MICVKDFAYAVNGLGRDERDCAGDLPLPGEGLIAGETVNDGSAQGPDAGA